MIGGKVVNIGINIGISEKEIREWSKNSGLRTTKSPKV